MPRSNSSTVMVSGGAMRHTEPRLATVTMFMLSPRSSGINAQQIVLDAGMGTNFFDKDIVEKLR